MSFPLSSFMSIYGFMVLFYSLCYNSSISFLLFKLMNSRALLSPFVMYALIFEHFLLPGLVRCSRLILYFPWPGPNYFSKELKCLETKIWIIFFKLHVIHRKLRAINHLFKIPYPQTSAKIFP